MRSLLAPRVSRQTYGALLWVFYHYYTALEDRLTPALNELLPAITQYEYQYVRRSPLLKQDLVDLNVSCEQSGEWPSLPLPATDSLAAALGVLYVVEGSTQGGRIIAPLLARSLGVGPTCGGRFFGLNATGNRGWPGFLRLLNTLEATPTMTGPALDAARDTFQTLRTHLDAGLHRKPSLC